MRGAEVPLSCTLSVAALPSPLPGTAARAECSGVAAVPLPTLECFVFLWMLARAVRSCGHPELGTVWAAPPGPRTCLGPTRGRGCGQRRPGRGRGSHRSQGRSQQQAGDAADGGSRGGRGQDPAAPASPALLLSVTHFPLPAYRPPPPQSSPALKPQISARQRLEIVEIKSARICGRAQGAVPGMACGAGTVTAVWRDPRCGVSPLRFPRRQLRQRGRRAGGGGVRRAAGRADADSERTFCSRKRR